MKSCILSEGSIVKICSTKVQRFHDLSLSLCNRISLGTATNLLCMWNFPKTPSNRKIGSVHGGRLPPPMNTLVAHGEFYYCVCCETSRGKCKVILKTELGSKVQITLPWNCNIIVVLSFYLSLPVIGHPFTRCPIQYERSHWRSNVSTWMK